AAHMLVVVVVPALAQSDQREPKIIAAFIARFVTFVAEYMSQRVDAGGGVKQYRRAEDEAPHEELQPGDAEGRRGMLETQAAEIDAETECRGNRFVEAVEPDQLGETRKVADALILGRVVARAHEPAGMGAKKAVMHR